VAAKAVAAVKRTIFAALAVLAAAGLQARSATLIADRW